MLKTFGFTMPKLWSTGSLDLKTSRRKFVPCTTPGSPILGGFIWPDRLRVSEPARCNCFKSRLGAQIASPCIGYEILCMRPQGPQGARTHACIQCLNVWQTWGSVSKSDPHPDAEHIASRISFEPRNQRSIAPAAPQVNLQTK